MKTKKPSLKKQLADSLAERQSLKNMHAAVTEQLNASRQSATLLSGQLVDLRNALRNADDAVMRFRLDANQARENFASANAAAVAWQRAFEAIVGKGPAK